MLYEMTSGNELKTFYRADPVTLEPPAKTIAFSLKLFCTVIELEFHGGTFRNLLEIFV